MTMTLPFGISSLCMQLLWAFIFFLPPRGYNLAHGYSISDNADVSRHFNSGPSMRWDGDTSKTRQSFVFTPHQVHTENNEDAGSVTSLREETIPSKPHSGDEPDEFSVESPGSQHHYGLLVKKDKQTNSMEGVSFPTIRAFKQFIETMKSSFLIPGSDLRIYFQTARQIMENEVAQNMKRGPEMTNRSQSAGAEAEDDASLNDVWSEPANAASEESEPGSSSQIPSDNLPVLNPADLTSVYDQHQSGQGSAFYPAPHSAATEHVWDNSGSFESAGISLKNTNTQDVDIQSSSYNLPEQIPSGSFFREEFSPRGHKTAPNINPSNRSPQDFNSAQRPMAPEENIQLSMYAPQSKGSLSGIQKTSGAFGPRHFQSEERRGGTDMLLASQVPSLNFYSKTSGSGLRPRLYSPVVHLHVSSGSLPSSSDMAAQISSPHDAQDQPFNNKQPFRSHQLITSQPSGSLQTGRDDYLRDQRDSVTAWSFLDNQEKEGPSGGPSKPPEQNQFFTIQESPQQTENIQKAISGRYNSNYDVRSPLAKADYTSFRSLATAPTSASETPLSGLITNKIMSRNLWMKNVRPGSDQFPSDDVSLGRYTLGSFLTPKRRHMSPKRGNVNAASTGFPEKFRRWTRPNRHPNEPRGFFSGNTFHSLKGIHKSTPSVKAYVVHSRRDYVRSKVLQSNTRYQLDGKNW